MKKIYMFVSPVIFWPLVFAFVYMFVMSIPKVRDFLSKDKPKKIFKIWRRSFWSAVCLFSFCFLFVEHFLAAVELDRYNRWENTPPRPIAITSSARDPKSGCIVVWYTYTDTGEKEVFRMNSPIVDFIDHLA